MKLILIFFLFIPFVSYGNSIEYLLRVHGAYDYILTDADHIENVHYTKWFAHSFTGTVSFGKAFEGFFYWGLSFSYWFSGREYLVDGEKRKDSLDLNVINLEIGYLDQTVQYYYLISLGLGYPLKSRIITTGVGEGTYTDNDTNLSSELRINVGFKFSNFYSFLLELGYRYCYLGRLMSNETPFMNKGVYFSGPFIGAGFAFHI